MTGLYPRSSWAKTALLAALVAVVVAAALAVAGHHRSSERESAVLPAVGVPARPVAGGASIGQPAPVTSAVSATLGGEETSAGAAAVAAGIIGDEPLLVQDSTTTAQALVASWADPSARTVLGGQFASARAGFVDAQGGPYRFDVAPLAMRATPGGSGRMSVDAWCVEVVFERGQPSAATYVTETLTLRWSNARWLLVSMTDTPGPAVALSGSPTPAAAAGAALAGFAPPAQITGARISGGQVSGGQTSAGPVSGGGGS